MAATEGWYAEWFANGWFPSVWFAPADETAVPPEQLQPQFSGAGAGGKLSRAVAGKKLARKPGWFGRQDKPREGFQHDVDYEKFRDQVLEPVNIEADDEEVLMLLVQMVGEL